ncbi:NAD+ synthase [Thiomicrospira sp. WB1]|uniref:NAD+ synthase n=1 Tax=Thiomicrospira sp. WB1 TaxID=1685380 RepID=UPI00074927AA|nr:NAD+ synthase [Thiomicrospira sp. WB1]KUJ71950.1 NAD synthetase [Thiomicrospira sp. WB1]
MSEQIRLCMAQINPVVGDVSANVEAIIQAAQEARTAHQADIVVFPEMTLTGYPPEDLLFRPALYEQVDQGLTRLCEAVSDVAMVVGYPMMDDLGERFNMAAWIADGEIQASYIKQNLPNYSVFDEKRYFSQDDQPCVVHYKGVGFGLLVCEDIWKFTPASQAVEAGANILLNLNASPFSQEKHRDRIEVVRRRVNEVKCPIVYVNQVGGQDELVFDGGSFATCAEGEVQVQAPEFVKALTPVTVLKQADAVAIAPGEKASLYEDEARIYQALKLGLKDYVHKNGFQGVLLGLSGGIDSALTLAIAVDALGADQVEAVMMPFHYTAQISQEDAAAQAKRLNVAFQTLPIETIYAGFESLLAPRFEGRSIDTTEENLQARIRGVLLMAMSNKLGKVVLATSNKSEVAVGYSTLYGDMVGGFSPLKDVSKTWVYRLARYRNQLPDAETAPVIPPRVIERPPSAELRPDQTDQDTLPEYDVLDPVIEALVGRDESPEVIATQLSVELALVRRIAAMIQKNEYKRRQSAPGVKVSPRAFGRDRRYPITSGYKE